MLTSPHSLSHLGSTFLEDVFFVCLSLFPCFVGIAERCPLFLFFPSSVYLVEQTGRKNSGLRHLETSAKHGKLGGSWCRSERLIRWWRCTFSARVRYSLAWVSNRSRHGGPSSSPFARVARRKPRRVAYFSEITKIYALAS